MSLATKFRKAERLLERLDAADRKGLHRICCDIRDAQTTLLAAADKQMARCIERCKGICCRNVELDPIISHWDLMLILTLAPQVRCRIGECLQNEDPLYTSDCIFLADGKGPCVFPASMRPEVCVTTFCENDRPLRREIRQVKWLFFKLSWFVHRSSGLAVLRGVRQAAAAGRRFNQIR